MIANTVAEKLYALEEYKNARNVAIYASMEKEIQTYSIIERLFSDGKCVFIPKCSKEMMEMIQIYSMQDLDSLPRNSWKIPEPVKSDERISGNCTKFKCLVTDSIRFQRSCFGSFAYAR